MLQDSQWLVLTSKILKPNHFINDGLKSQFSVMLISCNMNGKSQKGSIENDKKEN